MNAVQTYFTDIWKSASSIAIGMKVTFLKFFEQPVTVQYPEERLPLPKGVRNRLFVNIDDCIGCDQCAMACPVNCIEIDTIKSTPDQDLGVTSTGQKKRLHVSRFEIDLAKCCYCALCVYPCPTECIYMTQEFEFSDYKRENLLYKFSTMTPEDIEQAKNKLTQYDAEQAAKRAAAAAEAAAKKAAAAANAPAGQAPAGQAPSSSAPAPAATQPDTKPAVDKPGESPEQKS